MTPRKPSATASDWTNILSDPAIASHLGDLLKAYREAPLETREQALLEALKKIKRIERPASTATTRPHEAIPLPPVGLATSTVPPFEPSLFEPTRGQDRRRFPRMKCFVAVEVRIEGSKTPLWGNLSNLSPGGCFVEAATFFNPGAKVDLGLWIANGELWVKGLVLNGVVTSHRPASGMRVKFAEMNPGEREILRQFVNYVVVTTRNQDKGRSYVSQLHR
jgi:PilZ domain-containing protein